MKYRLNIVLLLLFCCLYAAAATITVSVKSYNTVVVEGDDTEPIEAYYYQEQTTHTASRLLSGESASLSLTNLPEGTISEVRLSMHSNKGAGAGSLNLTIGGKTVWSINNKNFNSSEWAGKYTNEYTVISRTFSTVSMGDLDLTITATDNSLYFNQLTIVYTPETPVAHTVRFATQTEQTIEPITEKYAQQGILLPDLQCDVEGYSFVGWTEEKIEPMLVIPIYYPARARYYPTKDCVLYALYVNQTPSSGLITQDTVLHSGEYVLVSVYHSCMAGGSIENQMLTTEQCNLKQTDSLWYLNASAISAEYRYYLEFEDDSLSIYHSMSNSYIGFYYRETQSGSVTHYLKDNMNRWAYKMASDHSLFIYHKRETKDIAGNVTKVDYYALYSTYFDTGIRDDDIMIYKDVLLTYNPDFAYILLFPVEDVPTVRPRIVYCSYAGEWRDEPERVYLVEEKAISIDWKEPVTVYTMDGRLYFQGYTAFATLPAGCYVVVQGQKRVRVLR